MAVRQRVSRLEKQLGAAQVDYEELARRARKRQRDINRRLHGLDFQALRVIAEDKDQLDALRRRAFEKMLDQTSGDARTTAVAGLRTIQQQKCDEGQAQLEQAVTARERQIAKALLGANRRILRMHRRYRLED